MTNHVGRGKTLSVARVVGGKKRTSSALEKKTAPAISHEAVGMHDSKQVFVRQHLGVAVIRLQSS